MIFVTIHSFSKHFELKLTVEKYFSGKMTHPNHSSMSNGLGPDGGNSEDDIAFQQLAQQIALAQTAFNGQTAPITAAPISTQAPQWRPMMVPKGHQMPQNQNQFPSSTAAAQAQVF